MQITGHYPINLALFHESLTVLTTIWGDKYIEKNVLFYYIEERYEKMQPFEFKIDLLTLPKS